MNSFSSRDTSVKTLKPTEQTITRPVQGGGHFNLKFVNQDNLQVKYQSTKNTLSPTRKHPLIDLSENLEKLNKNIHLLRSFTELVPNWNLNGAGPFAQVLVQKAVDILKQLDHQPHIFPTGRDSIQFEYEKKNGDYLEFEIFETHITYLLQTKERNQESNIKDINQIKRLVSEFHA